MLATIICDIYRKGEAGAIADALDEVCSPLDNSGWASACVYCFWDPVSKQILYLGLASDLGARFRQHNGLEECEPRSCKVREITEYFGKHNQLGFSFFAQSPLDQPNVLRNVAMHLELEADGGGNPSGQDARDRIRLLEGALIKACEEKLGAKPPWNKIGGSREGQDAARVDHFALVSYLAGDPSILSARATLRELEKNPSFAEYEQHLHAARMQVLDGMTLDQALNFLEKHADAAAIRRLRESGYLDRSSDLLEGLSLE